MAVKKTDLLHFQNAARRILALDTDVPVNTLGGYGAGSEVIYEAHPSGCPSVLVDSQKEATATYMSNGSIAFVVKLPDGMEVRVLDGHFDAVEKREIGVPSNNVWMGLGNGDHRQFVSLMNPAHNTNLEPQRIRIVKVGDPARAMWYCGWFKPASGMKVAAAVRLSLEHTPLGPALHRDIYIENVGKKALEADLWTYFNLHGTQRFVYNKELWYDAGAPVTPTDLVMTARVPYSEIIQIKHLATRLQNMKAVDATCDYSTFVGDTADSALRPRALREGHMLKTGAGHKINRFATAAIGANQFTLKLKAGEAATAGQTLLFVTNLALCERFKNDAAYIDPSYQAMSVSFGKATKNLLAKTSAVMDRPAATAAATTSTHGWPAFEIRLPHQRAVAEYANSAWMGVKELYENCRAHGARLADGIELGTRDRGQDMWPKLKEDPGRVRADIVHAMSFMYVTQPLAQNNVFPKNRPLTLPEKLHGMFPRQFPSQWNNRSAEVRNDNRPYADSPLWLLNSINMYVRETGDASLLAEPVKTIRLVDAEHPETSAIIGHDLVTSVAAVMDEVLACFQRLADDSPYGIAQIMYGDWCDPIDMFGTSTVGDAKTRGRGRGVQIRLSAHAFLTLVETIDLFSTPAIAAMLNERGIHVDVARRKAFASRLRENIVKVAWEAGGPSFPAAFLNCIHELRADGSRPDYANGEIGYTLGSMKGTDFDGIKRRELAGQVYCLEMLLTRRPYLSDIPDSDAIVAQLLKTVDKLFYDPKLGLVMFTRPIANNAQAIALSGRMGVLPAGTAENGEYHHCQVMMHRYRLSLAEEADTVWRQFKPMMSAMRDASLCGPFETPATSYVSDRDDPHFGKGMYFGLSGSVDWIVEVFHKIVGLEFSLHDAGSPAIRVNPRLPEALRGDLTFRRMIHHASGPGVYRQIPLTVEIARQGRGKTLRATRVTLNGQPQESSDVRDVAGLDRIELRIVHEYGK